MITINSNVLGQSQCITDGAKSKGPTIGGQQTIILDFKLGPPIKVYHKIPLMSSYGLIFFN